MANRDDDLKRLRELEQQVRECTDEDLLKEAEELEREMQAQHIEFDIPPNYLEQILTKGKLIEAERSLYANQEPAAPMIEPVKKVSAKEDSSKAPSKLRKLWNSLKNE